MKQKIKINYGPQSIINAYKKSLKSKSIDFICMSNNYATVIGDHFDIDYVKIISDKGIRIREILPDTMGNREAVNNKNQQLNQVRFIKTSTPIESDVVLCEDKVLLVSFDPQKALVLEINDKNMVSNLKLLFESLWNRIS